MNEQLFLDNLALIEKLAAQICRRHHFRKEEAEDFLSMVKIKLIEDDYAVLRKFEGKSTLKTYLQTVIGHLMLDHQNHLWGKWRPSSEASRLGPVAILVEKLTRDGFTFDEIVQTLQTNHRVTLSAGELADMVGRLPARVSRHMTGEDALAQIPGPDDPADDLLAQKEQDVQRIRAHEALQKALESIPPEERLILKMQGDRFTVAQISRRLGLDQKQLYRRIERTHKHLRLELERQGVRKEDVLGMFEE